MSRGLALYLAHYLASRWAFACISLLVLTSAASSAEPKLQMSRPSDKETAATTTFDAPRKLIFDALTKPALLKQWFGPDGWSLDVCDIDLKPGGAYRLVWRRPSGTELAVHGVYRQVKAPERLVRTEAFEPAWPGGDLLETTVLTEREGKTTVVVTLLYRSKESRDSDAPSAEHGAKESFARLNQLVEKLQAQSASNKPS